MDKQKMMYWISLVVSVLAGVANIVLFATKIFPLWLFLTLTIIFVVAIIFVVLLLKKTKKVNEDVKEEPERSAGDYNVDLYKALGIPLQYNKDGSVKTIYELLGLEPIYDDKGNRVETVYELLKLMPKFKYDDSDDENGCKEIPLVFAVKNRVGKIAKVDVSSRVLTRKLTEEEKEAIKIKEALTQKLKEAEQNGNKQMQEAIKKVIDKTKKPQKKESGEVSPKYKIAKSKVKAVKSPEVKYKAVQNNSVGFIEAIFSLVTSGKSKQEKPKENKPGPEKKPQEPKQPKPNKPEKPKEEKPKNVTFSFKVKLNKEEADEIQPEI